MFGRNALVLSFFISLIAPTFVLADKDEATDNVDKPVIKPVVVTSPAPIEETDAAKTTTEDQIPAPTTSVPVTATAPAPTPTPPTPPTPTVSGAVSAEQSLKWLTNGNARYVSKKFRADGRSQSDRTRLVQTQKPHAIVLACSDSRVPPELLFDQGLGEITVIRVAGEVLDASVIASIESTIINHGPHLLIVLGHTRCESIDAALSWKEKASHGSDALDRMVAEIKPHLKSLSTAKPSPELQVESALQADGVARDLIERSDIVKKATQSRELTIKTGLYWIDSGRVKFY